MKKVENTAEAVKVLTPMETMKTKIMACFGLFQQEQNINDLRLLTGCTLQAGLLPQHASQQSQLFDDALKELCRATELVSLGLVATGRCGSSVRMYRLPYAGEIAEAKRKAEAAKARTEEERTRKEDAAKQKARRKVKA